MQLSIQPMHWGKVDELHNVQPLGEDDVECMQEIRAVLQKHNKLERFALHIIHKHFELAEDEILVEYSDPTSRQQYFRPEKVNSSLAKSAIPTTWILKELQPLAVCVCAYRMDKGHLGRHETR